MALPIGDLHVILASVEEEVCGEFLVLVTEHVSL
jgi:hypothetical protein